MISGLLTTLGPIAALIAIIAAASALGRAGSFGKRTRNDSSIDKFLAQKDYSLARGLSEHSSKALDTALAAAQSIPDVEPDAGTLSPEQLRELEAKEKTAGQIVDADVKAESAQLDDIKTIEADETVQTAAVEDEKSIAQEEHKASDKDTAEIKNTEAHDTVEATQQSNEAAKEMEVVKALQAEEPREPEKAAELQKEEQQLAKDAQLKIVRTAIDQEEAQALKTLLESNEGKQLQALQQQSSEKEDAIARSENERTSLQQTLDALTSEQLKLKQALAETIRYDQFLKALELESQQRTKPKDFDALSEALAKKNLGYLRTLAARNKGVNAVNISPALLIQNGEAVLAQLLTQWKANANKVRDAELGQIGKASKRLQFKPAFTKKFKPLPRKSQAIASIKEIENKRTPLFTQLQDHLAAELTAKNELESILLQVERQRDNMKGARNAIKRQFAKRRKEAPTAAAATQLAQAA